MKKRGFLFFRGKKTRKTDDKMEKNFKIVSLAINTIT